MPVFWLQKWIELGHVSGMSWSSNMAAPYKNLFNFGNIEILNYSLTSPKLWLESQKLASSPKSLCCIHFWSQKSGICYLRGFYGPVTSWWKTSITSGLIHRKMAQQGRLKPDISCVWKPTICTMIFIGASYSRFFTWWMQRFLVLHSQQ